MAAPSPESPPRQLGSLPRTASYTLLEGVTSISSSYSPQPQRRGVPGASFSPLDKRDGVQRPAPIELPSTTQSSSQSPASSSPDERPARNSRIRSLQHPAHEKGDYEWLRKRLCDGEAATCLSLTGNWAVALTKQRVGEIIDYTVRDKVPIPGKEVNGVKRMQVRVHARRAFVSLVCARLTSIPACASAQLITLTNKFEYHVLAVYGDQKGRAIVLQPRLGKGPPGRLYIAFRGMRNRGTTPEEDIGAQHDRRAFSDATPSHSHWLPERDMRVHNGIQDHHASLWMDGLKTFLSNLQARVLRKQPLDEVLFVGLSMGGALAELTAYRCACEFPELRPYMHVLSFGSIPWANDPARATGALTHICALSQHS